MKLERRYHPRIPVSWSVTLHNVQGHFDGRTKDISVDGVSVLLLEKPAFGENFPILLKPSLVRHIEAVVKRVWLDTFDLEGKSAFGMGAQFIYISPEAKHFIATLVEKQRKD